ncbi:MAG: tRNA pseudouridine(13) synthase TruD [Phycisphaerales bacterium]|nr:MAG: tRNA pseudouridine(13) synthase TruD [Phycisphaerales bacterium]
MTPDTAAYAGDRLPFLTAHLPGVGGAIKRYDADFFVEELPLYEPSGEGTHAYFTIEKQGLATLNAIKLIAQKLGKRPNEIGYAGLKDAHGVTQQMFSVEHVDPAELEQMDLSRVTVLAVNRHTNKLKLGHLAGNRFVIKIRDTITPALYSARPIFDVLAARGVPNYFGPQRFGARGDNARVGLAVLRDDYDEAMALILGRSSAVDQGDVRRARELFDEGHFEEAARAWPRAFGQQARICRTLIKTEGDTRRAWRAVDHTLRRLYISAVQSELFNRVLARRVTLIDKLETGDVAWKHRNGACFHVEDAAVEQPRCDAFEISPTGPLFGRRMMEASGGPGDVEVAVLSEIGLAKGQVRSQDGARLDGARRPLRVPLAEAKMDDGEDDSGYFLRLSFKLPPGAYATNVTRELCKSEAVP